MREAAEAVEQPSSTCLSILRSGCSRDTSSKPQAVTIAYKATLIHKEAILGLDCK
jgi:hypothetical protein